MSEFCDFARAQNFAQNWPTCTELIKQCRNCKLLQILSSVIALSPALMAATASTKHLGVKVVKYFAVQCSNAAVMGVTISNCNKLICYMCSVTSVVSWCQKRQGLSSWPPVENNI